MVRLTRLLKLGQLDNRSRLVLLFWIVAAFAVGSSGCTREFFRQRADKEVAEVLGEKDKFGDWRIEQFHVYPDPRARFADSSCPDHPPKPPDDPAAYQLSPNP